MGTMGLCAPWIDSFIHNQNNHDNIDNNKKIIFVENLYITH